MQEHTAIPMKKLEAIDNYIDTIISHETELYKPGIETFEAYSIRIRKKIADTLKNSLETAIDGYQVLKNECDKNRSNDENPLLTFDENELSTIIFTQEKLGQLGLSFETVQKLYLKAIDLYNKNAFDDAKKAFYFLTAISPNSYECWLALGHTYASCKEIEAAEITFKHATYLYPEESDAYEALIDLYIQNAMNEEAKIICQKAIDYAYKSQGEPWADTLRDTMMKLLKYI